MTGDPDWQALRRSVLRHCRHLTSTLDDAEDICQEAFRRVLQAPPDNGNLPAALHRAAHSAAIDARRLAGRQQTIGLEHAIDLPDPSSRPARIVLRGLSTSTAATLLLHATGDTQEQLAAMMGIPRGTVSRRIMLGRKHLGASHESSDHREGHRR